MTYTRHLNPSVVTGIFLAPALLLLGCTQSSSSPPQRGNLITELVVPDDSRIVLTNTENSLVSSCMRRSGFKYIYSLVGASDKFSDPLERYLYRDDVEKAGREGYGIADSQPEKESANQLYRRTKAYKETLTKQQREKYEIALYGRHDAQRIKTEVTGLGTAFDPTEGCLAEARKKLYGDYNRWVGASTAVRTRFKSIGDRVQADSKYIGVTSAWQSCMAKKGYAYKDPGEVTRDSLDKFSGRPDKKQEEIKLAVDDAECDRQVGRSKVHRELFDKYTQAWAEQNEAHITAYRELVIQAVQRAKSLI